MRRLSSAVVLSASLLVVPLALPAAPVQAAPLARMAFSGEVAFGEWSTCPTWELGASCVFTQVIAGNDRNRELNDFLDPARRGAFLHYGGPSVVVRHYWFDVVEVDGALEALPTKESFGGIGVPGFPGEPAVRIDTRLRGGTASATDVVMHTTDYAHDTERWETNAAVSTTWTGTGPLDRVREGSMSFSTSRTVLRDSTTGWLRDVIASGRDSMVAQWGSFLGGYLFHGSQLRSSTYRGTPTGRVATALEQLRTGRVSGSPLVQRTRLTTSYGEAAWTTCPAPAAGDRCRDVSLWFGAEMPAGADPTRWAGMEVADYEVVSVEDGWVETRLVAVVSTTATPTSLSAPTDLSGAQLAVVDASALLCDAADTCVPTPMSFTGSWTGTGTVQRFAARGMGWGDWGREWVRIQGTTRAASAAAAVSGLPAETGMNGPVVGSLRVASLTTSHERRQVR